MNEFVSFNGQIRNANDPAIGAMSGAALYGNGVFTTIAIINGLPFVWEKHWRRLIANGDHVGLDVDRLTEFKALGSLNELLRRNDVSDGRARITVFDETPSAFWTETPETKTSVLIMTAGRRPPPKPFHLTISPHRSSSTSPLAAIKSCNYLDRHLARNEASARGFHEAVQLNERGEVAGACMANVFWARSGKLFTPSTRTGCLPGTTREFVIENAECVEIEAGLEELRLADDIFLTSAGIGVVQVNEFEGRTLNQSPHAITGLIASD